MNASSSAGAPLRAETGTQRAGAPASTVTRQQFFALFSAVMLPMFLASVDQTLLATATPAIARDFGGLDDTSWIALGYLMATLVMVPLYGRLGDHFGHRRLLAGALGLFMAGSLLGGFAPGMGSLVAARVLQGLGGGGLMVLSQALIGELLPPRERPRYQGYFAGVFTLSSIAGPLVGGAVVHWAGWRWLFWGLLPLGALALWRVLQLPQRPRPAQRAPATDALGIGLFSLAIVLTMVWITFAGHRFALASPTSLALLAGALAAWALLVWQERRTPAAFLPIELLALESVGLMSALVVLFAAAMFALVFFMPIYLQLAQGGNAGSAGVLMLPLLLGMAAGGMLTGRVISRTGRVGRLAPLGLLLAAISLGVLALVPPNRGLLVVLMVLCGTGLGTVMPNSQLVVQMRAGRARLGAASALVSLARATGASLGTAVFGAAVFGQLRSELEAGAPVDAILQKGPEAAHLIASAFHWAFGGVAVLLLIGAWVAWRIPVIEIENADPAHATALE